MFEPYRLNAPGLPPVGLGCASISRVDTTDAQAEETILTAWQEGIRTFDTAPMYGSGIAELRLGRTLAGVPRDQYVLSTKVGRLVDDVTADGYGRSWHFDFTRDGILRSVEASIQRIGVDRFDTLFIHDADDHFDTALNEALPTLLDLRRQGVVEAIGVGMTRAPLLARFGVEGDFDVFLLAGRYSLLNQDALDELFDITQERGIAVQVAQMLHGGLIEGVPDPQIYYRPVNDDERAQVAAIAAVCHRFDVPLAAVAIQFPLTHPAVTGLLTGPATAEQVRQNLGWLDISIPDDLWIALKHEKLLPSRVPVPGEQENER
jgi:D-threo-aldose 1-dehydrogenase